MLAMLASDLRTIGQLGSTVCVSLLLDTLIVRSFVVPSILTILRPWFWWPTVVRTRPLPQPQASSSTSQMTGVL
jgi:putative drug exporter of the RND superfamily